MVCSTVTFCQVLKNKKNIELLLKPKTFETKMKKILKVLKIEKSKSFFLGKMTTSRIIVININKQIAIYAYINMLRVKMFFTSISYIA